MSGASKFFVGGDHTGATDNGRMKPITGIRYILSDDNEIFVGDETGTVLTQECPYATQAMAEAALKRLKGYEYQMASVEAAGLDPAAELGDGVAAGGVYFAISRISDDGEGFPNITAPGEEELEDEYPTNGEGPLTTQLRQKISNNYSAIIRTDENIKQIVADVNGQFTSVNQRVDGVETTITSVDGRVTTIKDTVDGITITGKDGKTTYLNPGSIETGSINGDKITAGTINGDRIEAGTITGNEIKAGSIGTDELNSKYLNIGDGKFVVDDGNITIQNCDITLKDYSITGMKLDDDAVDTRAIANDAVKSDQIYNGAVTAKKINARGLRIGPSDNDIQFEVTEEGQVNIKGNVKIAGSISWENVTGTDGIEKDISTAKTDAGNAKTAAEGAAGDVKKLANGTFTQPGEDIETVFISSKRINAPEIHGGRIEGTDIYGGGFHDLEGSSTLDLLGDGGEGKLRYTMKERNFTVLELNPLLEGPGGPPVGAMLTVGDVWILSGDSEFNTVWVHSNWDFSDATVTGLTAKFG